MYHPHDKDWTERYKDQLQQQFAHICAEVAVRRRAKGPPQMQPSVLDGVPPRMEQRGSDSDTDDSISRQLKAEERAAHPPDSDDDSG